jgi:alpha-glucoside transport system permease protein
MTPFAILWGVGGIALLYTFGNMFIEQMPQAITARIQPYIFVGPAVLILFWYLAFPTIRTIWISVFDNAGGPPAAVWAKPEDGGGWENFSKEFSENFVGVGNYAQVFSGDNNNMRIAFRNNLYWILFGASASVIMGLLIAVLADRSKFENVAKAIVFLPMAISFVGAGVIWNFIYEYRPSGESQIGLANAILTLFGVEPTTFAQNVGLPWGLNNIFLIVIVIWLQTGYAMVLFSAAIKGIPSELLEAARVDGASEVQIFFRIMVPVIWGTIITVTTTVVIFTLKVFDVVWVMTGGQFDTQVIGTQFYRESFTSGNSGTGSALAIILLIAVIPVMIYNLRDFSKRRTF